MTKTLQIQSDIGADGYNARGLLDVAIARCKLKNDAALARALGVPPSVISKIRHHVLPVGPSMMIRLHDASQLTMNQIRAYLGMPVPGEVAAQ